MTLHNIPERSDRIAAKLTMELNRAALIKCHLINERPADTVAALVKEIGYEAAKMAVAETVNAVGGWDGRISDRNRKWCENLENVAHRDELLSLYLYAPSEIHPAHLDQIASAMAKYEPAEEPEPVEMDFSEVEKPAAALECPLVLQIVEDTAQADAYQADRNIKTSSEHLKRHVTALQWQKYEDGRATREQTERAAMKRIRGEMTKRIDRDTAKMNAALSAPRLREIEIHVHWVRNPYWGYNPHCDAWVRTADGHTERYTGRASGCGYDKRTAAIADALEHCEALTGQMIRIKEAKLRDPDTEKVCTSSVNSNAPYLGYGAGYGAIPYLEGGVGINSTLGVLENIGGTVVSRNESRKHDDFYLIMFD